MQSNRDINNEEQEYLHCSMSKDSYLAIPLHLREEIEVKSVSDNLPEYKDDDILKGYWREYGKLKDKIKKRQFENQKQIKTKL